MCPVHRAQPLPCPSRVVISSLCVSLPHWPVTSSREGTDLIHLWIPSTGLYGLAHMRYSRVLYARGPWRCADREGLEQPLWARWKWPKQRIRDESSGSAKSPPGLEAVTLWWQPSIYLWDSIHQQVTGEERETVSQMAQVLMSVMTRRSEDDHLTGC